MPHSVSEEICEKLGDCVLSTTLSVPPATDTARGDLRVILADDHPLFTLGVSTLLKTRNIGRTVATAENSDALVAALHAVPCDILITDFSMPGGRQHDGLRLIEYLTRTFPALPVIVLTMHANPGILASIAKQKIAGLLSKVSLVEELPTAVQAAMSGRLYMSQSVRALIGLDNLSRLDIGAELSPREAEVLRLFASGMTGNEIAEQLKRSKKTISRQKMNGMRKLGVSSDAEFFVYLRAREGRLFGP